MGLEQEVYDFSRKHKGNDPKTQIRNFILILGILLGG